MTDIVERLCGLVYHEEWLEEAAAEIKRLRALMKTSKPLYEELWDARKEIERLRALSPDNLPKNENEWWIALKDQNREIERLQADNHKLMLWNEQLQTDLDMTRRALEPKP